MNNLSSYCGLTDSRMRACDTDLPVLKRLAIHRIFKIITFVLSVRFGILQHMEQEFGRFLGPTSLRSSVDLSLSMSADTSHKPSEGNDFGLVQNILQVSCSTVQGHLFDGLGCLPGVLCG